MTNDLVGQIAAVAVPDDELAAAIAERLVLAGARVRQLALPPTSLSQRDLRAFQEAIAELTAEEGRLDIWVQGTAAARAGPVAGWDVTAWQTELLRGIGLVFAGMQAAGRIMQPQGYGAIVLLTSVDGLLASAGRSAACGGAAAVMMLTKVLACEWAAGGVRVNALASTYGLASPVGSAAVELTAAGVSPSRIPLGRPPRPSELAEATLYLASPQASFVTGETLRVDGGWTGYHLF